MAAPVICSDGFGGIGDPPLGLTDISPMQPGRGDPSVRLLPILGGSSSGSKGVDQQGAEGPRGSCKGRPVTGVPSTGMRTRTFWPSSPCEEGWPGGYCAYLTDPSGHSVEISYKQEAGYNALFEPVCNLL